MATIEDQREKSGFWFEEDQLPGLKTLLRLDNIYAQTESKFQKIEVIKTIFGRTLVTDGKTQSAEIDESVYHETLVQPSMLLHSLLSKGDNGSDCAPKKVFIGKFPIYCFTFSSYFLRNLHHSITYVFNK